MGKFNKNHIPWNKGLKGYRAGTRRVPIDWSPSVEHREKISKKMKGRKITWGEKISIAKKGHSWPIGYSERQSIAQKKRFEKDTVWNKGMGMNTKTLREKELEYGKHSEWRKQIFERDNYTCKKCGKRGGRLEADHIKMWALYPECRYEIKNGQTLCKPCHMEKTKIELSVYWKNQFNISKYYKELNNA